MDFRFVKSVLVSLVIVLGFTVSGNVESADTKNINAVNNKTLKIEIKPLVPASSDPNQWSAWREALLEKREQMKNQLAYNDTLYRRADFAWVSSCYSCCFVMMCDMQFYNPATRRFTVHTFVTDGIRRFGGYDAVVLWHAYPRIGFDNRNQFDFYRDTPGGLPGLKELCRQLHDHGVKAFIDYNP
ncbi:hypothetical protein ACFL5Z_12925 [Planctomycetota bacterium]